MGPAPHRTPLFGLQEAAGGRMVDFFGWEMAVSFDGILSEHSRVRQAVGLFDVSHMGQVSVSGPASGEFLDNLLTNRISACPPGKGVYSPMCAPDGGTIDDLIAYRTGGDTFLVVVNAANREDDVEWMRGQSTRFGVHVEDSSDRWAMLALQGPEAPAVLGEFLGSDKGAGLGAFGIREVPKDGISLYLCRTGYTGEDGFEILIPVEAAERLAGEILSAAGREHLWCGLGARDSLRLEAGFPLYGHELAHDISPVAAGLGWAVKTRKPAFTGKEALQREKEAGPQRRIRHFVVLDRRIAREKTPVVVGGEPVGEVRSGAMSPVLGHPIGSALVDHSVDPEADAAVEIRGRSIPIRWTRPPLHKNFTYPDNV